MIGSGGDGGGKQVEVDSIGKSIEEGSAAWQSRAFRRVPDGLTALATGIGSELESKSRRPKSGEVESLAGSTRHVMLSVFSDAHADSDNARNMSMTLSRSLLPIAMQTCWHHRSMFAPAASPKFTRNDGSEQRR